MRNVPATGTVVRGISTDGIEIEETFPFAGDANVTAKVTATQIRDKGYLLAIWRPAEIVDGALALALHGCGEQGGGCAGRELIDPDGTGLIAFVVKGKGDVIAVR